jgi:REP element-mobilizing transposase RayT
MEGPKAKRARKVHVQQGLRYLDRNGQRRGGKRKGAGRPPKGSRSSEKHKERALLSGRHPILVTVRVAKEVGNLRKRQVYRAIRYALYAAANRDNFRVVHFSLQRTHLHLIVEASNKEALSRGMQGLLISAARHINSEIKMSSGKSRRGVVFPDRYHATVLKSPKQCRNAISYVLNNWRRHKEDQSELTSTWVVDPFSSAVNFGGWRELEDSPFLFPVRKTYERLHTCRPQTWLLSIGWTKHGLIGATEIPGRPN